MGSQEGSHSKCRDLQIGSMLEDILFEIPLKIEIEHQSITEKDDRLKLSIVEMIDQF
mgnify:CR=1 FL=1